MSGPVTGRSLFNVICSDAFDQQMENSGIRQLLRSRHYRTAFAFGAVRGYAVAQFPTHDPRPQPCCNDGLALHECFRSDPT